MIRLNPTWGSTNKSNTVLNLAIGLIFAYLIRKQSKTQHDEKIWYDISKSSKPTI